MSESVLVIGVNKTGGLPPLSGAVSGAEDFADWARSQGMSVVLITDDNGAVVSVSDIQDEIDKILAPGNCTKLIVYFSGHGFLQGANTEVWLLTKAPRRDQEAVNVRLSMDNARYSRIPHVIFVSDACRSGGPTHQHRGVTGASIFGAPTTYEYDGKIDSFYATRPGDVALEYKDENEAVSNFKGLFTECLLTALNGNVPTLVTKIVSNGNERWVIQSEHLETHLETNVPIEAANISIKLSQKPQIIPESRLPQFFGELTNPTQSVRFGSDGGNIPPQPGAQRLVFATRSDILLMNTDISLASKALNNDEEQAFVGQVDSLISATGRDHFETETGFTVYGNARAVTTPNGWNAELFVEGGVNQIRLVPESYNTAGSILIEFDQGFGTVLAANPGYIGTVVVEDNKVVSVNYTPSRSSPLYYEEYEPLAERVNRRRAFAATAMRHGLFVLEDEDSADVGSYLRMMKKLDPTLGIYASYAYQQAGRLKSIRSVLQYMADDGLVPYDILLLARQEEPWPPHAPFCPMLRQGWALLELHPPSLERLVKYRSELLPSLWTLFTPEGAARIREDLESGELQ
ncbi:MAG: caspase family protein [Candidatus Thiodiazotropha taylori]